MKTTPPGHVMKNRALGSERHTLGISKTKARTGLGLKGMPGGKKTAEEHHGGSEGNSLPTSNSTPSKITHQVAGEKKHRQISF